MEKVGKKRLEFLKIGIIGITLGRPDERILVGQSSNNAGHYLPPIELGNPHKT